MAWGSSGVRCKVQGRFRRFPGGLVQARCKVQGRWRFRGCLVRKVQISARKVSEVPGCGVVWCRAGVRFKAGFGGSRKVPEVPVVQARCKAQGRSPTAGSFGFRSPEGSEVIPQGFHKGFNKVLRGQRVGISPELIYGSCHRCPFWLFC